MKRVGLVAIALGALCTGGCVEPFLPLSNGGLPVPDTNAQAPAPAEPLSEPAPVVASLQAHSLTGALSGRGQYKIFDLGPSSTGDDWTVVWGGPLYSATPFIITLFDERSELLSRSVVSAGGELRHVMRSDAARLSVGIAPANGSSGGSFNFSARRTMGALVPPVRPQLVWLNFGPGHDVRVHGRAGINFEAFEGGLLGPEYALDTELIKREIVAGIGADYAAYNVLIYSSDDGPPPAEPHTVVHFGGDDPSLLGLADSVDLYNQNLSQTAIVYVNSFAAYRTMELEAAEFAVMITNVASHELGHLLGLYHTRNPDDVMDTTGSAWDLADEQWFGSAQLEASVFPTGFENSPQRLSETVGLRPSAVATSKTSTVKPQVRAVLRQFAEQELRHACGICVDLDGCAESRN